MTVEKIITIEFICIIGKYLKHQKKQIDSSNTTYKGNNNIFIPELLQSYNGLQNFWGNCAVSSIMQILIHTQCFLKEFLSKSYHYSTISKLFLDFLKAIAKNDNINHYFSQLCYELEKQTKVIRNDPMYFCIKFLEKLEQENPGKIIHLFLGKKKIEFLGLNEYDNEEDFLFYIIQLNKEKTIIENLFQKQKNILIDGNKKPVVQKEYLIKEPTIFLINIEPVQNSDFNFEIPHQLLLNNSKYEIYAVNQYNNVHSIS